MVPSLVKGFAPWLVLVLVLSVIECESKKCGVICRVRDPLAIGQSHMLKECLYEVYPVESTQNAVGNSMMHANGESRNRLFALYGGPSSCEYFGGMIQTAKGRQTLVETIQRQLQKSGFKGLDLQCDPVQARVNQQTYADFVDELRSFLGNTYVIMVTMAGCQLEPRLIDSLNRAVDFVTINAVGQSSALSNALMFGLARHRVLLVAPFPSTVQCPLNNDHSLNEVLNQIEHHHLFGTVVQIDQDDVHNVCGEGPFPLFRKVLDRLCPDAECNFSGYVRDTRNCGQYFSCENGCKKQHHCPTGYSFDLCKSSCEPFLQVNCNSTTCVVSGGLPNGLMPIPYPIPFPIANPNCSILCNNNGGNNGGNNGTNTGGNNQTCDCCEALRNLTIILTGTQDFSNLVALVKELGLDDTIGILRTTLTNLTPALNKLVTVINNVLGSLLNGQNAIDGTTDGLMGLNYHAGLLGKLIELVKNVLNGLLGTGTDDPLGNLLGGLLGGPPGGKPPVMPPGGKPPVMPPGGKPPVMPPGGTHPVMPPGGTPPVMPPGGTPPVVPVVADTNALINIANNNVAASVLGNTGLITG